jgi:hypothetical protein
MELMKKMNEEFSLDDVFKKLTSTVDCLLAGEWGLTEVKDIPIPEDWKKNIGEIPVAVHVCIGHECAVKLRESLWELSPFGPDIVKNKHIDYAKAGEKIVAFTGRSSMAAAAGVLGLRLPEFAKLLGSIALYIAVNSTLIATQLELFEKGNGVCLHKGPLPWPLPIRVGNFLLDIPVIVTPQVVKHIVKIEEPENVE